MSMSITRPCQDRHSLCEGPASTASGTYLVPSECHWQLPLVVVLCWALLACGAGRSGGDGRVQAGQAEALGVVPAASVERRDDPHLPPERGTTTITMVPGHGYLMEGQMLDLRGLEAVLVDIARENRFNDIRIITSGRSPVDQVVAVLDLCQRLGLSNVSLSRSR